MEVNTLVDYLKTNYNSKIKDAFVLFDMACIEVDKSLLLSLITDLKKTEGFAFLTDLTVVHYPKNEGKELCCSYLLHNWLTNTRLRIKSHISIEDNTIDSLTAIYPAANWLEREAFDNFGVKYMNHPDLRRILNMDEMDYHPLLKQYALEDETRKDKNDTFFGR